MSSKQAPPAVALPRYAFGEEIANATTHALGIALAVVGLVVLSVLAARSGTVSHVVAGANFGAALVLCFTTSTLYHAVQPGTQPSRAPCARLLGNLRADRPDVHAILC